MRFVALTSLRSDVLVEGMKHKQLKTQDKGPKTLDVETWLVQYFLSQFDSDQKFRDLGVQTKRIYFPLSVPNPERVVDRKRSVDMK